jgi:proliferating cell nuclear antigen
VRDLNLLGESVRIEIGKEGVRFASDGEAANGNVLLKETDAARKRYEGWGIGEASQQDGEEEEEEEGRKKKAKKEQVKKENGDVDMEGDGDEEGEEEFSADKHEKEGSDEEGEASANKKKRKKAPARVCVPSSSSSSYVDTYLYRRMENRPKKPRRGRLAKKAVRKASASR